VNVAGDGEHASGRRGMDGRLLAWFAMVVGIVYLVLVGGSWVGIYLPQLRVVSVGTAAVAIVAWAGIAWRRSAWRPSSVLTPAILAVIASLALSTLFSRAPRISLEYLGYTIVLAALYFLLVRLLADPFFRHRLAILGALLFVGISTIYIVAVLVDWTRWWTAVGRITLPPLRPGFESLTYGNPSAVLTLVALLAMPTAAVVRGRPWRRSATWLAIGVLVGIVALMTSSRAGWLALGLTTVIVPAVWLGQPSRRILVRVALTRAFRSPRGRVAVVGVAIVALTATALLAPIVVKRAGEGGDELRAEFAVIALRLFGESPVVGTGPGTWVIQRVAETMPSETDYYIPHAHNLEVQTLAELGLVGATIGVFLAVSVGRLIRAGARDPDPERRRWAWAAGIGVLYFVLHQLLDFYANMPAVLFAAVLPVAYLDATAGDQVASPHSAAPRRVQGLSRHLLPAAIAVVLVSITGLLLQEIPALQFAQATDAADSGNWAAADGPARAAAAEDPEVAAYDLAAGLTAAHAGDHLAAATYFRAVLERTELPEAWLDLAAEQFELGNRQDAIASLRHALRLGWQRPAVGIAAGDLALRAGQQDMALDALSTVVAQVPSLAGDPWWSLDPARRAIFPRVVDAAIEKAGAGGAWEIALMAGQDQRALTIAQGLADPTILQRIAAWNGNPGAMSTLFDRCLAQPLDLAAVAWCGRVAGHNGDIEQSDRFREIAQAIQSGAFASAAELRVNEGTPVGRIEGSPASFWGTFTYRRTTPQDILVPSLVHLTIE
jgi:tetratricopeptide (TPR) repeat protein